MKEKVELPKKGYAVIRCHDGVIVARLQSFPECERALMYRRGSMVSFMPLQDNEIIGTPLTRSGGFFLIYTVLPLRFSESLMLGKAQCIQRHGFGKKCY